VMAYMTTMSIVISRDFELVEGASNKFWKITVDGVDQTVHYSRTGTAGQTQTKTFASAELARASGEKLIAEKLRKGYSEISSGAPLLPTAAKAPVSSVTPTATVSSLAPVAVPPIAKTSTIMSDDVPITDSSTIQAPDISGAKTSPTPPASVEADDDDPLEIIRSVDLTEDDYVRAGLRPRVRKKLPASKPFVAEEVGRRVFDAMTYSRTTYNQYKFDPAMSREEALMLFHAFTKHAQHHSGWATYSSLEELLAAPLTEPAGKPIIPEHEGMWARSLVYFLIFKLYSPAEFVEIIVDTLTGNREQNTIDRMEYIRTGLLPYASDDALAEMQNTLTPYLSTNTIPKTEILLFATTLRMFEPVKAWIEKPHTSLWRLSGMIQHFILALGDAEFIERQYRQLDRHLSSAAYARQWLAASQTRGLDLVVSSVSSRYGYDIGEALIKVAGRVLAPETAPHMLTWLMEQKAQPVCKEWFEANPKHAAAGLTPIAGSNDEKRAAEAAKILRNLVKRGYERIVRAHLQTLPPDIFERISGPILEVENAEPKYEPLDDSNTPDSLRVTKGADSKPKPGDILIDEVPSIAVLTPEGLRSLNDAQFYTLLHALQKSKLGAPLPYVTAIKAEATPQSRDAFAWGLMEKWLSDGALPKEKWKMTAVGLLGGEQCVLKLTPLIREWPGESQHARAVSGLECLEAIGTDTALMQINGIAQKVAFKGLKGAAVKCMEGIAEKRGLTRPELEDRIVPDCGLDERGSRRFDFGPRQFVMSLSPEMKPMLREVKDGKTEPKRLTDLPKPNQKDDPDLSEAAVADWKILKKQVSDTAKIQAVRLEQAMVTGRRWKPEEFELLLVRHPLMTNIARLLVWAVYDNQQHLISSFRITEDLAYATPEDDVYNLPEGAQIGIAHPLQLTDAVKGAWGEIWSDYELVPPFPQLGRPIYALEPDEKDVTDLKRFNSATIPASSLVYTLEKLGWMRALPGDGGGFREHTKPFYGAGVTAVTKYADGVYVGDIANSDDQKITGVFFIPRIYLPNEWWPEHKGRIPWSEVDPVVISEVLADLSLIAAKAK